MIFVKDGIIQLDSDFAKAIGFTSDKFDGWLWKKDDSIYISFIVSKQPGKGNLSKLCDNILNAGYNIKVPTPLGLMEVILRNKGFTKTFEWCDDFNSNVEVWVKQPEAHRRHRFLNFPPSAGSSVGHPITLQPVFLTHLLFTKTGESGEALQEG